MAPGRVPPGSPSGAPPAVVLPGALAAALVLSGCAAFPEGTRVLAELDVGDLGPGDAAGRDVAVPGGWDFLFVGFRTGPWDHVHVVLRDPAGQAWDTATARPGGGCAATRPAGGTWRIEVAADALGGRLDGGKFTLRAGRGALPAVLPCADDAFPGAGRNATLALWNQTLAPGELVHLAFDQPHALARIEALAFLPPSPPAAAANASEPGAAGNATPPGSDANASASRFASGDLALALLPPGATEPRPADAEGAPPVGRWQLRVERPEDLGGKSEQVRLAIRGWG